MHNRLKINPEELFNSEIDHNEKKSYCIIDHLLSESELEKVDEYTETNDYFYEDGY